MDSSELGIEKKDGITSKVEHKLGQARERLVTLGDQAVEFIRKRPTTALIGAVAIGFMVGKLISRRRGS